MEDESSKTVMTDQVSRENENKNRPDPSPTLQIDDCKNEGISQCAVSQGMSDGENIEESKKKSLIGKKKLVLAIVAVIVAIAIVVIGIFAAFGKSDVARFIDYVRSEGTLSVEETGNIGESISYELNVQDDGDLFLSMFEDYSERISGLGNVQISRFMWISFGSGDSKAMVSRYTEVAIDSTKREDSAIGELDIDSYKFGDGVKWTDSENSNNAKELESVQSGSPELIEGMIRQLQSFVEDSGTGCTMQMLGFNSLS